MELRFLSVCLQIPIRMDRRFAICSVLFLVFVNARCKSLIKLEEMSRRMDEFLEGFNDGPDKNLRTNFESWQNYEFGTGVGNREELLVTNVTERIDKRLFKDSKNYQVVENGEKLFLTTFENHSLYYHEFDPRTNEISEPRALNISHRIERFKIFKISSTIYAIVCVELRNGTDVLWHRLEDDHLVLFDSLPPQKPVDDLLVFHHEGVNRLLIQRNENSTLDDSSSLVDIYGFNISDNYLNYWVTERLRLPKINEMKVCHSRESSLVTFRLKNNVLVYELKESEMEESRFVERSIISSNHLNNVVCFESFYFRYLVTSGPEAAVFHHFEDEFQHDTWTEHFFNEIGEIFWVESLSIDNYREESLLLVQLKNSTTIALSWKDQGFEKISLPGKTLDSYDLSRITVLQKYGFIYENKLVRIETRLEEKSPLEEEIEKLSKRKEILSEIIEKQSLIINETENRVSKSYFKNPEVSGFWNLSNIEVKNLTIKNGVSIEKFAINEKSMDLDEFLSRKKITKFVLNDLESKINETKNNFQNAVPVSANVRLDGNLYLEGNVRIEGTLRSENLIFEELNGLSTSEIISEFSERANGATMIEGEKFFDSLEAENLEFRSINGLDRGKIEFDPIKRDYASWDFEKLKKLKVNGNLNVSNINGFDWSKLMEKIVLKNENSIVPGLTILHGDLVSNNVEIVRLDGKIYPDEFVLQYGGKKVQMNGEKHFGKLIVDDFDSEAVETINEIPMCEFVRLENDTILREETIFEDLTITENLEIDAKITGMSDQEMSERLSLEETSNVTADVVIDRLTVVEDFQVENSINEASWHQLDDLVTLDGENVEIRGKKIFLDSASVDSDLTIERGIINGRPIDDFVTLDTDQDLIGLEKISGNVKFDVLDRRDAREFRNLFSWKNSSDRRCLLTKNLIFESSPTVEKIFFKRANAVPSFEFMAMTNRTFSDVRFDVLSVKNLRVHNIEPIRVNDQNYKDSKKFRISRSERQNFTGNLTTDRLDVDFLTARTIDGHSILELERLRISLDDFHEKIKNGSERIGKLTILGNFSTETLNGGKMKDFYDSDTNVIFRRDVRVRDLIVDGTTNGKNFTNFVLDTVSKFDGPVVIRGQKFFEILLCESLRAAALNGIEVKRILDPDEHQIISGSLKIDGTTTVLNNFATKGKIGQESWSRIKKRIPVVRNGTYFLSDSIIFTSPEVEIKNLTVTNSIREKNIEDFLGSVVFKNEKNLTVHGPVVFRSPVQVDSPFVISGDFNGLDLRHFYEKVVRVDGPLKIDSAIVFTKDVVLEKDLVVANDVRAKKIGGADLKGLHENSIRLDKSRIFSGTVFVNDAIFESNVQVDTLNGIDLRTVLKLVGDKYHDGPLTSENFKVGKLEISSGVDFDDLYQNTLTLTEDQNVSTPIIFGGNVDILNDLNASLVNDIDPKKMISLSSDATLVGNFIFEKPFVLQENFHCRGLINGVNFSNWEASVVLKDYSFEQKITNDWIVHGNVHFEKNIYGNDFLDGVNVTKFLKDFETRENQRKSKFNDLQGDLKKYCQKLNILKTSAEKQIYKFEDFENFQELNFTEKISSVHQYEYENSDYLLVNFESCQLDFFAFTGKEFYRMFTLPNVVNAARWLTLSYEEEIYFITVGKEGCKKSAGNLWKIQNEKFIHVSDLGNVTDVRKVGDHEFLVIVGEKMYRRSIVEIYQRSLNEPKSYDIENQDWKFVENSPRILLINSREILEYKFENETSEKYENLFRTTQISSFRSGIYQREYFIHYDESVSDKYLFISNSNLKNSKIVQAINVQNPMSILVINFDDFIENFLVFVESDKIKIYEYKGIEGFVYRESIRMKAEKLFGFEIRRYRHFSKKHGLAVVEGKKLTILLARMHGEKLDVGKLDCDNSIL